MEITIEITNKCNENCSYCSTNAGPGGKHLPVKQIMTFLEAFEHTKITRINISGGEPLSHPQFYKILMVCYNITENVWIYSNLIRNLIYNTDVIKEVHIHANVCLVPGKSVYIPKGAQQVHLLQLVPQGRAKGMKPQNIKVSGNMGDKCPCNHKYLQSDGCVVDAPCKKQY